MDAPEFLADVAVPFAPARAALAVASDPSRTLRAVSVTVSVVSDAARLFGLERPIVRPRA